tara:strand:+ start:441 stop:2585 length:2145 start_codon:yes stop_codon:yes gene_type:complete
MSETSNTEVKINQEAQGAVDAAESKINAFSRFMGRTKKVLKDGDIPDDSKVTKADAFVTDMPQGKEETGSKGIAGFLADGVTGVILGLPLLLERGNKVKENEPVDIESEYQGSTKELEKEIKEEEKIREEGIDALKETAETGKKLDKKKVEDIKNIRPTGGSVKGNMPGSGLDSRRKDGTTTTTSSTSQGSTGPLTIGYEDGSGRPDTTDFREINKAKNQASSDQNKLISGERVERKNVTITPQNAEKFEEAVDNLKVRLKKNVVDKNVDSVSAAKSVKSDDDDVKPVLNELEGERKDLAKERLQLEKQRKQIQSVYGRDSVEYEEIQIKITKNKEKVKELPKASKGGIIQGPQEGYPVSLDGKKVDFIGHGTEEVRQKEDGNGAFIVPIDTPDTRKDPTLQKRREKEAAAMGFKSFSAGGMNPDKVFGAPLLDKDSDLYKYSDIDKVHENIDTQGTKYEYNEELARTTTKASEFDKPLKVEKKSSLMSPKEQYEFLVENLGGPQYVMQLVDGTYFPNVGLMMAEKWGDVARMVEKYMTEGAATVKEVSGVSVDKEVKLALKTFKKTFKDFERFKDRRTGEYDVEAMTSHLNSFVPGTIDYAKVQKKEAEKKERQQKLMENVKNKSEGGLLRVNTVNGYSMGGLLSGIMEYSNTESAPPAASSIIPIPVFQERPAPTGSVGSGKPPVSSEPTVISGSTEGEVMSAFLFTELGAS